MPGIDDLRHTGILGIISEAIGSGLSANKTLGLLREQGIGFRRGDFLTVYGQVAEARSKAGTLAGIEGSSLIPDTLHTDWATGRPGTFAYQVTLSVRDRDSGIEGTTPYLVISDTALSADEATDIAVSDFQSNTVDEGGNYNQVVRGGVLTGAYRMTGKGSR